ncbi:SET domain-containing protein [Basidiobolus meristosporus CBS 931.73]|uniref:SET domain-containing protein n=1 Tax=Basidiobolus meristosporus CBS 931.73 TaxID=1314790 RepID=A0A1Y1Z5X9_9FUNG|nr:SET domain-containing protein [Basidiobolus meristosporus CBS 931.73]|eukprot:ORY05661.1 SET domain-containing protein [Basidiobolus meristosporus CBS 931.73]
MNMFLWSWVFYYSWLQIQEARLVSLDPKLIPSIEVPGTYVYRHFYSWDYPSRFNITYLSCVIIDPEIKEWLSASDLQEQLAPEFDKENERVWRENSNIYSKLCEQQDPYEVQEIEETPKVYIRWVNSLVGWGLFAEEAIPQNTTIGIYTGILSNKTTNFDYSWEYNAYTQVYDKDNEPVYIAIDGMVAGNHLRFVNHNEESKNVFPLYALHDGMWWIFYVATESIEINQQLLTDYGKAYWESEEDEIEDEATSESIKRSE